MKYRHWRTGDRAFQESPPSGFTLIEALVVLLIIGLLAAIVAPAWAKFYANRQVATARNELRQGIQQAQNAAIANRGDWRFSLREINEQLVWAVHDNNVRWQDVTVWHRLSPEIVLHNPDTTLARSGGTYYVRFGFRGNVRYRLSTVTLDSKNGIAQNQCVVISTLIGATRNGKEHIFPKGDRHCY